MKLFITSALALVMATGAFAGDNGDRRNGNHQAQGQIQGQLQGQLQGQAQQAVINDTGDAYAPSVSGGNPCALGASFGIAGVGTPGAGGIQFAGRKCVVRQEVQLMNEVFGTRAAAIHAGKWDARMRESLIDAGILETANP